MYTGQRTENSDYDDVHTHTMYVCMGDVRKSSFLRGVCVAKLFVLNRGLKIMTERHVHIPIQCTWVWKMHENRLFRTTFV